MTTTHPRPAARRTHPHREHRTLASQVAHPLDHSPEVLLALSLVLVVVAGPVLQAVGTGSAALSVLSVVLLLAGVVLAIAAARLLLRS